MGHFLPGALVVWLLAVAQPQVASAARLTTHRGTRDSSQAQLGSTGRKAAGSSAGAAAASEADDAPPACSCDCCSVVERRPDEVVSGATVKCSPASGHSEDTCSEQCSPAADDQVLRSSEEQILDYQRFCFFECKPAPGTVTLVGAGCVVLDPAEVHRVVDKSGNAIDPAVVYASALAGPPLPQTEQVQQTVQPTVLFTQGDPAPQEIAAPESWAQTSVGYAQAISQGAQPQQAVLLGQKAELRGRRVLQAPTANATSSSLAANATGSLTEAEQDAGGSAQDWVSRAATMAKRAHAAAASVRAGLPPLAQDPSVEVASAGNPFGAIADIRRAADDSQGAAERAEEWARKAAEASNESDAMNMRVAQAAAQAVLENASLLEVGGHRGIMEDLNVTAEDLNTSGVPIDSDPSTEDDGRVDPQQALRDNWQRRAAQAVRKASKPFFDVIKYSKYVAWQWNSRGQQDEAEAAKLQRQAQILSEKAASLEKQGLVAEAQISSEDATAAVDKAQALSDEAQLFRSKALQATENVSSYYRSAEQSAAWVGAFLPVPPE